jgi:hypothetical protein
LVRRIRRKLSPPRRAYQLGGRRGIVHGLVRELLLLVVALFVLFRKRLVFVPLLWGLVTRNGNGNLVLVALPGHLKSHPARATAITP